ncbi:hypothetical protein GOV12_07630 [Candidatus Pacearchaeota archaeon]|nr:hypothetical protein [Candidatus Pacearchaeota archaeon]
MKKSLIIVGVVLIVLVIVNILLFSYFKNPIEPNIIELCDDQNYIKSFRLEDKGVTLIGDFKPSTVYNKDNSVVIENPQGDVKLELDQTLIIYNTEECTNQFELIEKTNYKIVLKHTQMCAPPGPNKIKECDIELNSNDIIIGGDITYKNRE